MELFSKIKNIFKKPKKEVPKKKLAKKVEPSGKKAPAIAKTLVGKKSPEVRKKPSARGKFGKVYRILREPHISEKATQLFDEGKYTFRVFSWANKTETKKAVEDLYGVRVKDVKIINIKPKSRTLRGLEGKKRGYKKAIVVLEKGEKIEIMPH